MTPAAIAIGFVVLAVANTTAATRLLLDPDDTPPLAGRIATALMAGVPLAAAELAAATGLWLALRPG